MNKSHLKLVLVILAAVLLIAMFALPACSAKSTTATSSAPASSTAAASKTLVLGSITALSLPEGLEIQKWNNLFAKLINDAGGWKIGNDTYKLVWNTYDVGNYGDSNKTQTVVQKAIFDDKVQFLLNNFGGDTSVSANQADQNGIIDFEVGFTDDVVQPTYNWIFRPNGGFFGRAMNFTIYKDYFNAGAKTYIGCTVDSEAGHISAMQYGTAAQLAGLKTLDPIFFGSDTVDYGPIATKIMSFNPDMIDMVMNSGPQVVSIVSALKNAGWKGKVFPGAGLNMTDMQNLYKQVGTLINGMEMPYTDPVNIPVVMADPYAKSLVDAYKAQYGEWHSDGCFWVGSWFILRDAINKTQSVDKNAIKTYLETGKQGGVMDLTGYTELFARPDLKQMRTVDAAPGHGIGKFMDGNFTYTGQATMQDHYLVSLACYAKLPQIFPGILQTYRDYWAKNGKPNFPPEKPLVSWDDFENMVK
jgi:ABC-type branched-subunit amino acid transport system substrate-binding protein